MPICGGLEEEMGAGGKICRLRSPRETRIDGEQRGGLADRPCLPGRAELITASAFGNCRGRPSHSLPCSTSLMRCTAPCTAPPPSTPTAHRSPAPRFTRRRPPASTRASTPSRRAHPGSALGPATIKRRMERMYNPAPSSARRLLHVNSLPPRRRTGLLHHA